MLTIPPRNKDPESPKKTLFFFFRLKKNIGIIDAMRINDKLIKGVIDNAKNSNIIINNKIIDEANPSIPSMKFIELIIATIIKIVIS